MKILLISSGSKGIYPYLELAIEEAFIESGHSVTKINPVYNRETLERIKGFTPDIIITLVGYKIEKQLMEYLKKSGSVLCVWLTEDPFYIDSSIDLVRDYQYIFTIDIGALEFYKQEFPDKNIFHLPLGTIPSLYLPSDTAAAYSFDLCLVGYPYPERVELVNCILNQTSYSLIVVGPQWKNFLKNRNMERLTVINKWMAPQFVRRIYNTSKIILNPHRDFGFSKNENSLGIESKSINNRTFDIAVCEGFQLIPEKSDLGMHFNVSNEIVSYFSNEHCIELIQYFMKNDKERDQYSRNVYKRVLNSHTFFHRIQFILNTLS